MKILIYKLILLAFFFTVLGFAKQQKTYLPVWIHLSDTTQFNKEILLNLKIAFAAKKIKTINKEDALELQKIELGNVLTPYFQSIKNNSSTMSQESINAYMDAHAKDVCSSLNLIIQVNSDGIIGDTVRWSNRILPYRFNDERSKIKKQFILQSHQKVSVFQVMQTITDSIITSNILAKS